MFKATPETLIANASCAQAFSYNLIFSHKVGAVWRSTLKMIMLSVGMGLKEYILKCLWGKDKLIWAALTIKRKTEIPLCWEDKVLKKHFPLFFGTYFPNLLQWTKCPHTMVGEPIFFFFLFESSKFPKIWLYFFTNIFNVFKVSFKDRGQS